MKGHKFNSKITKLIINKIKLKGVNKNILLMSIMEEVMGRVV